MTRVEQHNHRLIRRAMKTREARVRGSFPEARVITADTQADELLWDMKTEYDWLLHDQGIQPRRKLTL